MPGGDEMTTLRTLTTLIVPVTLVVGAAAAFAQPRATPGETIDALALRLAEADFAVDVEDPAR
jgi:hypothetical protein